MAEKMHWSAEPSSYRMSREHDDIWALVYDPTPGGRKNDDGITTYSMRFPALVLSEYVQGPGKVAADLARKLNTHDKLVKALTMIDALDPEDHVYGCSADALRGLVIQMGQQARTALASLQTQEEGE